MGEHDLNDPRWGPFHSPAEFLSVVLCVTRSLTRRGASSHDAEDISSVTIQILLEKLAADPNHIVCLTTYAITVSRRLFFQERRRARLRGTGTAILERAEPACCDPQPLIEMQEILEKHQRELFHGLSDTEMRILRDREAGQSVQAIAEKIGSTESYVRNELSSARRTIRANIARIRRESYE